MEGFLLSLFFSIPLRFSGGAFAGMFILVVLLILEVRLSRPSPGVEAGVAVNHPIVSSKIMTFDIKCNNPT